MQMGGENSGCLTARRHRELRAGFEARCLARWIRAGVGSLPLLDSPALAPRSLRVFSDQRHTLLQTKDDQRTEDSRDAKSNGRAFMIGWKEEQRRGGEVWENPKGAAADCSVKVPQDCTAACSASSPGPCRVLHLERSIKRVLLTWA